MVSRSPILFIADFNIDTLARQIANTSLPGTETRTAPYGAVMSALDKGSPGKEWLAVVWTRPDAVSPAFRAAIEFADSNRDRALDEARSMAEAIGRFARGTRTTLVPSWVLPPSYRGYGPLDMRPGLGVADLLARMNLVLAETLASQSNVFVLDTRRWLTAAGGRGWSDKLFYASKSPFTLSVVEQAAADVAATIEGLEGRARRLLIVDLDDLLWGGIVGEVGWQGLNLGGHDVLGEAYADFQRGLKALTRRGIQLAIVSKNDEAVALEAIDHHPEMQLRRSDFAGWRINWQDKAQNVNAVLAEIGLGAESAVFIDDSAIERARVATALPDVLVPDWPGEPTRFREALSSLRCFDAPFVTNDDRTRTAMYAAERSRRESVNTATDLDSWIRSLEIVVAVEPLNDANLDRAAQLFNKTNQMNLATRRLSNAELKDWASAGGRAMLTFRVSDRFGDSGLTGLIGLEFAGTHARLVDFLISCRVMGRGVEETMLHVAVAQARARGAASIAADFLATARNAPCLEFFRRSGFRRVPASREMSFTWETVHPYDRPQWIDLRVHADVDAAAANR